MTNPVPQPAVAGVPAGAAPVPAPTGNQQVPAPVPAPVDPAAAPVGESDGSDDQTLLAMQLNSRFSVVKQSGGEAEATKGTTAPAPPAVAPAGPPQPAAAPAPATLPSTTG